MAPSDPAALPAEIVFRMATMGSARVLNLHEEIGSLELGKRTDVVLVDVDRAEPTPHYHIYSHLMCAVSGSDVNTVIMNGHIVVQDREILTVDEKDVIEKAHTFRAKVQQVMADLGNNDRCFDLKRGRRSPAINKV